MSDDVLVRVDEEVHAAARTWAFMAGLHLSNVTAAALSMAMENKEFGHQVLERAKTLEVEKERQRIQKRQQK